MVGAEVWVGLSSSAEVSSPERSAFGYVQGGASVADGVVFDFLAEEEDYCFNVAAKYGAVEGWFVFSVERVEFGAFVEEHTHCPNTAVEGRWLYYHFSSVSALVWFNLIPVMYRGGGTAEDGN